MIFIDAMNVSALDLNLLKAFDALYTERHVTRAGEAIGLAQPSMSNALSRLRAILGDPLFVKTPQGMMPTPRADTIAPKVSAALALISDAFEDTKPFDPATTVARITISASDNLVTSLAPRLAAHLAQVAPSFDLRFAPFEKDDALKALDQGDVDIVLARFTELPARFHRQEWMTDSFVVIARKGHPLLQSGLTLDNFCSAGHVLTSFRADSRGAIDDGLARLGRSRHISMVVSQFSVVPDIIAQTNYIATVPATIAESLAERAGCEIHSLPISQKNWAIALVWSAQTNADPAKKFAVDAVLNQNQK
ncbi:MAG: LysR family transcriptional regulator [Pseudomonadota bacterium]